MTGWLGCLSGINGLDSTQQNVKSLPSAGEERLLGTLIRFITRFDSGPRNQYRVAIRASLLNWTGERPGTVPFLAEMERILDETSRT